MILQIFNEKVIKSAYVTGAGPYLRGGGSGSNLPVGLIMLILTHYFNENLRLKYPKPPQTKTKKTKPKS